MQRQRLLLDVHSVQNALTSKISPPSSNAMLQMLFTCAVLGMMASQQAPEFIEPLKDLNVQEGEQIEFVCKLIPKPAKDAKEELISVEWRMNTLTIQDTPQTRVLREADGVNRLIVPDAGIDDAGTFHCIATNVNIGDSAVTSCKLNVFAIQPGLEDPIQVCSYSSL